MGIQGACTRVYRPYESIRGVLNKSAYHLYGKPGNSGENSNGTVHSGGMFSEKR